MDILKRYTGDTTTPWSEFYPKTLGTSVFDSTGTTALLNGSNKIQTAFLPDYILGQLVNGGTVDSGTVSLTANGKSKLGITSTSNSITLVTSSTGSHNVSGEGTYGYTECEYLYFTASNTFTFAGFTYNDGDWIVSTEDGWGKIDNNDAVTGVNSKTGAVLLTLSTSGETIILNTTGSETGTTQSTITVPFSTYSKYIKSASSVSGTSGEYCIKDNAIYNGTSVATLTNSITGSASSATNSTYSTHIGTSSSHPAIGSASLPVYVAANGVINACDGTLAVNVSGTAGKATVLETARNIAISSSNNHFTTVTNSFDGSTAITFDLGEIKVGTDTAYPQDQTFLQWKGETISYNTGLGTAVNTISRCLAKTNQVFYGSTTPTNAVLNDLWLCTA